MGLVGLFLRRIRPAIWRTARLELFAGPEHEWRLGLLSVAAGPVSTTGDEHESAAAGLFYAALLSAERRVRLGCLDGNAIVAKPFNALDVGHQLRGRKLDRQRGDADSENEKLGGGVLSGD